MRKRAAISTESLIGAIRRVKRPNFNGLNIHDVINSGFSALERHKYQKRIRNVLDKHDIIVSVRKPRHLFVRDANTGGGGRFVPAIPGFTKSEVYTRYASPAILRHEAEHAKQHKTMMRKIEQAEEQARKLGKKQGKNPFQVKPYNAANIRFFLRQAIGKQDALHRDTARALQRTFTEPNANAMARSALRNFLGAEMDANAAAFRFAKRVKGQKFADAHSDFAATSTISYLKESDPERFATLAKQIDERALARHQRKLMKKRKKR